MVLPQFQNGYEFLDSLFPILRTTPKLHFILLLLMLNKVKRYLISTI